MTTDGLPLVVGIPGTELGPTERAVLENIRPAGVILFARNVVTPEQVRNLTYDLDALDPRPFVSIDLEGGVVNRLVSIWGDLPSPRDAAAAGRGAVRDLGEAAGAACRALGIHLDLAPVVDLDRPGGLIPSQGRCLSDDPQRVATLARLFHQGLSKWGVEGCLKHFPGLGGVDIDTHDSLPTISMRDGDPNLGVFAALSQDIPLIMVGHVIVPELGDSARPASLSRIVIDRAAQLPGSPVVLSDDLEMGAVADHQDLPGLVIEALGARCHGVLVCKSFDRIEEISALIEKNRRDDPSFHKALAESTSRLGTLRRDLCQKVAAVPRPDDETVAQAWHKARESAGV